MSGATRFTCPRCGGHTFSSHDPNVTPKGFPQISQPVALPLSARLVRSCSDERGVGCRFEWPITQDALYMAPAAAQ